MSKAELQCTATRIRFIREPELLDITGLSATAIDLLEARGEFPRRAPLGMRAVGWVEAEVTEWQRRRIAIRDDVTAEEQARRGRRVREASKHQPDTPGPI
jgi:prophage regulatory protein